MPRNDYSKCIIGYRDYCLERNCEYYDWNNSECAYRTNKKIQEQERREAAKLMKEELNRLFINNKKKAS